MDRPSGSGASRTPPAIVAGGIVGILLLLATVSLLALTWGELRESREHIEAQDAKVGALLQTTEPALDELPGLVDDLAPVIDRASPLFRELLSARADLGDAADRAPILFAGLMALIREGVPLAEELRAGDLPGLATALRGLVGELVSGERLIRTLDLAAGVLEEVDARNLTGRAEASSRNIRRLLRVQRRAYRTLDASLAVQRRILERVRRIDERLGGALVPLDP